MAPQPRTSFGLVQHKARAILFGGVAEKEGAGDRVYSTNFDEMYQFGMEPSLRRWFPVSLRPSTTRRAKSEVRWHGTTFTRRHGGYTEIKPRL